MNNSLLPIHQVLPRLQAALSEGSAAVLIAEPGAGKTTQVPLALLKEPWLGNKKIIMLEPRRLAARTAARFMASAMGEQTGETVGYRVRSESVVGPSTRIEVVTEGILTRMLQGDPSLPDVGMIIFDEFHERSLPADTGLAFALESRAVLREDLKLLVMSATLDAEPVARLLGGAPVIRSEGQSYPVETVYWPQFSAAGKDLPHSVARAVLQALHEQEGDMLVFLPGAGEIRRTAAAISAGLTGTGVVIRPLYSALPFREQDLAIRPDAEGRRRIVLATSIAESSLTIEGVRVVVDSGHVRTELVSPRTGLPQLVTRRVSKASADQRRGRAGRLMPGVCYRLWSPEEHARLPDMEVPAIRQSDLAPLALELAAWGTRDPEQLAWLDPPPAAALGSGQRLLRRLGALDERGAITDHGRELATLGLHPRLGHMLVKAKALGAAALACRLAVLLQERDLLRGSEAARDCDMRTRLAQLLTYESAGRLSQADEEQLPAMMREVKRLVRQLQIDEGERVEPELCGLLLSFAYPDRIGKNRGDGSFLLANGRGARLAELQPLSRASYLVAAAIDDKGTDGHIQLAAELDAAIIERHHPESILVHKEVRWDAGAGAVRARKSWKLDAIVLKETPDPNPAAEEIAAAVLDGMRSEGLGLLQWGKADLQYRERMAFMHAHNPDWPDVSDEALLDRMEDWLLPFLDRVESRRDLQRLKPSAMLEQLLTWDQRRLLQSEAPTHIQVPSGSKIPVDYSDPQRPALAVRLQEMFGLSETPRIAGGKAALTIHLLSPAQRPVQVTSDLASFWAHGYFEVKKDLKGRYPKHYWPDDPLKAQPTSRVRPKS
ncbi:ATP-dependent helicase HrpB [Paenibacillus campinasensis]|uniref:ATP-dependent helicase HrpB n=1 Tax=Paenibacillus campinasensis TaxID=66347 RepID=A0A268EPR9_9BACL|nr:ATP-dependent helicase HrpB [Paenibacillus campinasensis]PAD75119.1 ATP-dependent helicase HrpB [Paenibacillus campinasensis]